MAPMKENLPINAELSAGDGGTITYANEVIAIIAGVAANEIEGLAGMCTSGGLGEIISKNRNITRGVKVEVGTEEVSDERRGSRRLCGRRIRRGRGGYQKPPQCRRSAERYWL